MAKEIQSDEFKKLLSLVEKKILILLIPNRVKNWW